MLRTLTLLASWGVTVLVSAIAVYLAYRGWEHLSPGYLWDAPRQLGRSGGIGPILANTAIIVGAALLLAVPIALAGSIAYAASRPGLGWRWFRLFVELGLSVPRLLWGLAGSALIGAGLGFGYSALTGIGTLTALLLPILVTGFIDGSGRSAKDLVPPCRALGLSDWRIWFFYVLPAARASLLAAAVLASGRACGDAAALYLTAGIGMRMLDGLDQSASTLAVHVFKLAIEVGGGQDAAFASAFVLMILTALLQLPLLFGSTRKPGGNSHDQF